MKNSNVELEALSPDSTRENASFEECLLRTPDAAKKYCLLLECIDGQIAYYSKSVITEDGEERRVARLVKGLEAAEHYRSKNVQLLVLESAEEFSSWVLSWGSYVALVEMNVWEIFDE